MRCWATVDVVWAPAPAPLAVGATPFVLTVHDRSWEERPQDFTRYERPGTRPPARGGWPGGPRGCCATRRSVRGELIREWGLEPDARA